MPETFEEHVKLMFDLQVLAYQTDLTRVITFMMAREGSDRTYPEIGVPERITRCRTTEAIPRSWRRSCKINVFHAQLFAYYLEKLQSTPDGDGSLLDHILAGLWQRDGRRESARPAQCAVLLAGGTAGRQSGGRHVRCEEHTPLSNAWVSVLNKLGVPIDRVGDSTGTVSQLW